MARFYGSINYLHIFLCLAIILVPFNFLSAQRSELLCEFSSKTGLLDPIENNSVKILNESTFFDELIESIKGAENYVLLESFIFCEDSLSTRILDILVEKVSKGVRSYLIFDYLGCLNSMGDERKRYLENAFSPGYIEGYRDKGLNIVFYNSGSFMPRNHRKLVIVDGKTVLTGGINVTELKGIYKIGIYHDLSIKIEGPAVKSFHLGFFRVWNSCGDRRLDIGIPDAPEPAGDVPLLLLETHGRKTKPLTQDMLAQLCAMTKDSLHIICPYIWPDRKLMKTLRQTAKKGVNIKILMGGISDVPKIFEKFLMYKARILAKEENIRLFINPENFHHDKLIISDGRLVWIGSHNLDILSLNIDLELSVLLDSKEIAGALEDYFSNCAKMEEKR